MRLPSWWPKFLGGPGDPDPRLTDADLNAVWAQFMRTCSDEWRAIPCTKQELAEALYDADAWLEAELAGYDAAPDARAYVAGRMPALRASVRGASGWAGTLRHFYRNEPARDPDALADDLLHRMVSAVRQQRREAATRG